MDTKRILIRIAVVILTALLGFFIMARVAHTPENIQPNDAYLLINNVKVTVEIAKKDTEKIRGLSYRDTLDKNTGMLFIYDVPNRYTFWMYEMRFPLDFIWIEDGHVADIHENIPHPALTNNIPQTVTPRTPVRYILEINAGWVKNHNIHIGDAVTFHNL